MSKYQKFNNKNGEVKADKTSKTEADMNKEFVQSFFKFHPNENGKKILDDIRNKQKKSGASKYDQVVQKKHDTSTADTVIKGETIRDAIGMVKSGKFGKAKGMISEKDIKKFIESYSKNPKVKEMNRIAGQLIRIAKSFRDYDSKQRDFMSDGQYDALLAVYLENGNTEPVPYVPSGENTGVEKTSVKYPTLHNNMDKAYAIRIGDPIPDGVKEKGCIEKFLQRAYKELGISSETDIKVELSPKIDGVSINGTIVKNTLVDPQTRGDESESVLVKGLNKLQVTDSNDKKFGIQYELFVTDENRVKLSNYLGIQEYVSCRHAASGVVSRMSANPDDKLLEFISLYPIMADGMDGTYEEVVDYLQNFAVVPKDMPDRKIIKGTISELLKKIQKEFERLEKLRPSLSFAIDGMVITITDDDYQKTIGREGRTNKYQIALKFDPANASGIVKDIWLDTGNKGYRTIQVDLVEPIFLDGIRYDHVPVLSKNLFDDLELRVGSEVSVHRIGDVIPTITMKTPGDGKKIKVPDVCPSCGMKLLEKSKKLYCSNRICRDNIIGRILDMFTKIGMTEYGRSFVEMLVDDFHVKSIADLVNLVNAKSIGEYQKKSKKLTAFPENFRNALINTVDYKIIGAMGIPGVGNAKAESLLKKYPIDRLIDPDLAIEDSEAVENFINTLVGPQTVNFATEYILSAQFRMDLKALSPYIVKGSKNHDGKRIGHSGFEHHKELEELIDRLGYNFVEGTKFDILTVKDKNLNSAKVDRAKKKNLPIMTIDEFLKAYSANE